MTQSTSSQNQLSSTRNKASTLTKPVVSLPILIGVVIFAGVIAFTGGMEFSKDQQSDKAGPITAMAGADGMGGASGRSMRTNLNGAVGVVTAVSSSAITVESQRDNKSTTYKINSDTKVVDGDSNVNVSDIKIGDTVMIKASSKDKESTSRILLNFGPPSGGPSTNNPSNDSLTITNDNI